MDQGRIAGIGKIYADEACFGAGINPQRSAHTLSYDEVVSLHGAIREVLAAAIEARGTSAADSVYRDVHGQTGEFQDKLYVYQRAGQPCRCCGAFIQQRPMQGRRMHFCPQCQR
jgi:formamidopyrimidine-DNA glycosylase